MKLLSPQSAGARLTLHTASNRPAIERALLGANPWLRPFEARLHHVLQAAANGLAIDDDPVEGWGPSALAARRASTLERFRAGGAWLRWVDAHQHVRADLAGRPGLSRCVSSICAADFRSVTFDASFDAAGFVWPTRVCFAEATFGKDAWLGGCVFHDAVDFSATRFLGSAVFERSRFIAGVDFSAASFGGSSEFRDCVFEGDARFARACFTGDAWFRGSRFAKQASFVQATFQAEAGLGASAFEGDADFSSATFADNAGFEESAFRGRAVFAGARFARNTWFVDNRFATPPNFERAHFAGRLRIDEGLPLPPQSPVHQQLAMVEAALAGGKADTTTE